MLGILFEEGHVIVGDIARIFLFELRERGVMRDEHRVALELLDNVPQYCVGNGDAVVC